MKKQVKLLTDEEKEQICESRDHTCARTVNGKGDPCPLLFGFDKAMICYKEDMQRVEDEIKKIHEQEIEVSE